MNVSSTIGRIAVVLATVTALTALGGVAQAGPSKPAGMSEAESRALTLRSEALNERYGPNRALRLRSEALNERYGLANQRAAAVTSRRTSSAPSFAWGAFGVGAAVTFGLALLAGGFLVRRRLLATLRGLAPRYRTT